MYSSSFSIDDPTKLPMEFRPMVKKKTKKEMGDYLIKQSLKKKLSR